MELKNDIYINPYDHDINRLSINSGVNPASGNYLEKSFIPNRDWRNPEINEFKSAITTDSEISYSKVISIVQLPENFKKTIKELEIQDSISALDMNNKFKKDAALSKRFNHELNTFLATLKTENTATRIHGIFFDNTSTETVAFNKEKTYLGLHFDNSRGIVFDQLQNSPNRISFNLGKSSRHLIFVDLSIETIAKLIDVDLSNTDLPLREISATFFSKYPNYPVKKVEIKPLEAYIAPTDNILHDGYTYLQEEADITLVIMGYFKKIN